MAAVGHWFGYRKKVQAIFEQPGLSGSLTYQEGLETQTLAFSVKPMKCSMAPWLIKASGHAAALEWVQVILSDLVTTVRYNMVVRSFFSGNDVIFCRSVVQCVCVGVWSYVHTIPCRTIPYQTIPYHCTALRCFTLQLSIHYIAIHAPTHSCINTSTSMHPCRFVGTYVRMYVGMCIRTYIH